MATIFCSFDVKIKANDIELTNKITDTHLLDARLPGNLCSLKLASLRLAGTAVDESQ